MHGDNFVPVAVRAEVSGTRNFFGANPDYGVARINRGLVNRTRRGGCSRHYVFVRPALQTRKKSSAVDESRIYFSARRNCDFNFVAGECLSPGIDERA